MRQKRGYRYRRCQTSTGRKMFWPSLLTGLAGLLFKDLTSDRSKIKLTIGRIFGSNREINKNDRKVINAEFKVLEDDIRNVEKKDKGEKK